MVNSITAMKRVLIDARSPACSLKLFDLTLLERILRQLDVLGLAQTEVLLDTARKLEDFLKPEFRKHFKLDVFSAKSARTLDEAIETVFSSGSSLIILEGDAVYDDRVLEALIDSKESINITSAETSPWALHLTVSAWRQGGRTLQGVMQHGIQTIHTSTMPSYLRFLRKYVEPSSHRVTLQTNLNAMENGLYENTFKSGMEFIAVYGYRVPVREMTRYFAKTAITPNMITGIATFCKLAAIPCFFVGWLMTGLLLAASFIILDSLDGKLARMTFRFSRLADLVDHRTTLPARIGWNLGMTWYFAHGDWTGLPAIAGLVATTVPFLDDINWVVIKTKFQKSLFDFTDLDTFAHLFTVKKHDIFLMILGVILGVPLLTFYAVAIWTVATWLWHSARTLFILFVLSKRHPELLK